ncbi:DnaJ C-terminal domain-containing protein [Rhizosaccharibacter radicis]|uniref:DnaJ domain-containing protein n=1 Tax=Rhizosaccharibacter radicis TaxID=2782605 RepID=A0ABT1VV90_9PROT|nr:DnaJ domain-containing protein [Acetobacteraceae bacterium KSS12]
MAQDPYELLGVGRDASADDIKRAYRSLARKLHPDLNPGDADAEARFKAINAAHGLLSDADKRARFDRGEIDAEGQERAPPPPPGGRRWREHADGAEGARYRWHRGEAGSDDADAGEFEDLFADYLRRASAGARAGGPRRGSDVQYSLTVSFLDATLGATNRITLADDRTLDVKIPPGIETGGVLRLRGRGRPGREGGADGDALIEILVAPHPVFTRDGAVIRLDLPVSVREAVLGERVTVPTPGGSVAMRLPDNADEGTVLRLRGKGIAAHGDVPAGDVLVTLRLRIGPRDAGLVEALRNWQPPPDAPDPRAELMAALRRAGGEP